MYTANSPWHSLRPLSGTRQWSPPRYGFGEGQAYYDLEIVAGPDGSTTELKLGLEFRTYKGGRVNERGMGTLN
jgi:hypothetical protein